MMIRNLGYTRRAEKEFETVVQRIEKAASNHGFRVLHIHDVQATLQEKGFEIQPYSIVEVCNARFAHQVLSKDKTVGMMLPCRIAVYEEKESVTVLLMRPGVINEIMPQANLGMIPVEVEEILIRVVDEAVS